MPCNKEGQPDPLVVELAEGECLRHTVIAEGASAVFVIRDGHEHTILTSEGNEGKSVHTTVWCPAEAGRSYHALVMTFGPAASKYTWQIRTGSRVVLEADNNAGELARDVAFTPVDDAVSCEDVQEIAHV